MTGLQPRERSVPCSLCMRPTWNTNAICGRHDAELAASKARHPAGKKIRTSAEVAEYQAAVRALREQR